MHIEMGNKNKKNINFELNLIPFIDMLSTVLCFLILTAVWTYVGTIDTKQAVGAESTAGDENPPSVVVQMDPDNSFEFTLKDVKTNNRHFVVRALDGQPDWERVNKLIENLHLNFPELKTSVVLTRPNVTYGNTIQIVDTLRKNEIKEVGISPM